jgi:hypothetical protein
MADLPVSAAQMEAMLADTYVKRVSVRLETSDGKVFEGESGPARASLTVGRMPDDMDFLSQSVQIVFGQNYVALIIKPGLALTDGKFELRVVT